MKLKVYYQNELLGFIDKINEKQWNFISEKPELSKKLMIQESCKDYFENLLPEENEREFFANIARCNVLDSWTLLYHFGRESAGTFTIIPENQIFSTDNSYTEIDVIHLDEMIEQRIVKTERGFVSGMRMSIAGSQHKIMLSYIDWKYFIPDGNTPSTHILKPESNQDYPDATINEYFCIRLAKKLGLDVPEIYFDIIGNSGCYIVERFDRKDGNRIHTLDGIQVLGLDKNQKYDQMSVDNLIKIAEFTKNPQESKQKLVDWLWFNFIIGNHDNHLKNISVIFDGEDYQIAPFYDLVSTAAYSYGNEFWGKINHMLCCAINDKQYDTDITQQDFEQLFDVFGVKPSFTLDDVKRVLPYVNQECMKVLVDKKQERKADYFNKAKAERMVNTIHHAVINGNIIQLNNVVNKHKNTPSIVKK